ncbi:MAG: GNAT family N-acetyltransferase [Candidatus Hermodarchaeota archaeon]
MSMMLTKSGSESQTLWTIQKTENIQIRPAELDDVEILGELWLYQRCFHEQWDEIYVAIPMAQQMWQEQLKSYLNQSNHCVFVAKNVLEKIVGYVHGSFHPWPVSPFQFYGSLNTIAVAEESQGQGIGKKLIRKLLEWFKEHQIKYISLHVDYRNQNALKMYQDLGFHPYQQRLMLDLG